MAQERGKTMPFPLRREQVVFIWSNFRALLKDHLDYQKKNKGERFIYPEDEGLIMELLSDISWWVDKYDEEKAWEDKDESKKGETGAVQGPV
jgi:hypothetical protein